MFERFTKEARQTVQLALGESHRAHAPRIDCEHLLIGLAHGKSGPAAEALADAGLDVARLRALLPSGSAAPLDADSLAIIGIDLDQVRRAAEAAFGPGALDRPSGRKGTGGPHARMSGEAKKAIELALRVAQNRRDGALEAGHLLVGILNQGGNGALRMLAAADVDAAALRADVLRRMADEAQVA